MRARPACAGCGAAYQHEPARVAREAPLLVGILICGIILLKKRGQALVATDALAPIVIAASKGKREFP